LISTTTQRVAKVRLFVVVVVVVVFVRLFVVVVFPPTKLEQVQV
jgi:hypothetical protein